MMVSEKGVCMHKAYRTSIRKPPSRRHKKVVGQARTLIDGVTVERPDGNAQRVKVIGIRGNYLAWRIKEGK